MSFEVQQSDRNAAHDIYDGLEMFGLAEAAAQGLLDNGAMVKAIANVRHQAEEAMRERAARELDQRAERARVAAIGGGMDPMDAQLLDYEYSNAAAAIRSIDTRGE